MSEHPADTPRNASTRLRFVTACQQLLVLAVVATVLTPAARTISLDVRPDDSTGTSWLSSDESEVPVGEVDPEVQEVGLTERAADGVTARARLKQTNRGAQVKSKPVDVEGHTAVGVTWDGATHLEEDEIAFEVRTRDGDTWSAWSEVPYHDEHGPDDGTAEAARAVRPGSDAVIVGDADQVQVRVETAGDAPSDMTLAVVSPGEAEETEEQAPSIDTGGANGTDAATEGLDLSAAGAPRPTIYSRAQWGANEELRDRSSLSYHEVHAGFVHHTVNANDYSADEVPGIIRSIYAYHTKSRGWSDIGYNFLVDRFGRIWEGRYGGVDRPVVGAHTRGYNDNSFAMSAIGNFETARPTQAMVDAYSALFAWKLSLHGIDATKKKSMKVNGRKFPAINGHRDAGSTACPGRYLYARMDDIRSGTKALQQGWSGRELESDLAAGGRPDLVVRRKSDGAVFVLPLEKKSKTDYRTGKMINTGLKLPAAKELMKVGDWDGDGHGDLVVHNRKADELYLHRGNGAGKFGAAVQIGTGMSKVKKLVAVGDFDGDGRPDLMGKDKAKKATMLYPGRGMEGIGTPQRAYSKIKGKVVGVGRWDRDGAPDLIYYKKDRIHTWYGNGPGGLEKSRKIKNLPVSRFNRITAVHNLGRGRHADLIARERGTGKLYFIPGKYKKKGKKVKAMIDLGHRLKGYDRLE